MMAIQKNILRINIGSDSQLVVKSINDKICIPKEILWKISTCYLLSIEASEYDIVIGN